MRALLILLFLLPITVFAQTVITGKVIDANNKPVPFANVFLSNTQVGTQTKDDGSFTLINVKPGLYDLVVSFIGYQTAHQNINAGNVAINLQPVTLQQSNKQLKEVRIGPPDPNRNQYLEMFTREFLGSSKNAADCKIINPEILDLNYDKAARALTASSDDFLIIENKALGYRIHYQLTHFLLKRDGMINSTYSTYYDGNALFENLPGRPSQIKKWEKKRLETYLGSSMHFLRTVIANDLDKQGFTVLRLIRKPNPQRPGDELIRARMRQFGFGSGLPNAANRDSLNYWSEKFRMPKTFEYLVKTPLNVTDFTKRTDAKNIYALTFPDYLYVAYSKKKGLDTANFEIRPNAEVKYSISIVTLNTRFDIFDQNGVFIDPTSSLFEGEWGKSGNAELLPVDYTPAP